MTPKPLAQIGPRAAFLLGFLDAPLTTVELYDRVQEASTVPALLEVFETAAARALGFRPGAISIIFRGILDGGTMEVLHQLQKLEQADLVARLGDVDYDGCLWWRTSLTD